MLLLESIAVIWPVMVNSFLHTNAGFLVLIAEQSWLQWLCLNSYGFTCFASDKIAHLGSNVVLWLSNKVCI